MSWCFAILNKRLAEIYFDNKKKGSQINGHCYVKEEEIRTKEEREAIKEDTAKYIFTYRKGKYRRII